MILFLHVLLFFLNFFIFVKNHLLVTFEVTICTGYLQILIL